MKQCGASSLVGIRAMSCCATRMQKQENEICNFVPRAR